MKPTLEQIKTDESVWPEGATHYIDGDFTKWIEGAEYCWAEKAKEWVAELPSWSLEGYVKRDYEIIPHPTKAFVPEVGGDSLLPEVGSIVGIYLASLGDILIPHVVKGYKVWRSINNDSDHHRVFILLGPSDDKRSGNNERLLNDIRPIKSERDKFVEDGLLVSNCREDDHMAIGIFQDMYDSGKFKLKEPTK